VALRSLRIPARIALALLMAVQTMTSCQHAAPPADRQLAAVYPNSLENLPLHPTDGQTIVFANQYPYIGDSVISFLSKLRALHEEYPHSKIKVVTPHARLLRASEWLVPVPLAVSPRDAWSDEARRAAEAVLQPGDFVIIYGGHQPIENALTGMGLPGIRLSASFYEKIAYFNVALLPTPPLRKIALGADWRPYADGSGTYSRSINLPNPHSDTMYEHAQSETRQFFGGAEPRGRPSISPT
jgi:hypothetical protein